MRSRVITAGIAASVSLALTACSSDEPDTSQEETAEATQSASVEATGPSPEAEETGVPAATGERLRLERSLALRLPEGDWHHSGDGSSSFGAETQVKDGSFEIIVAEVATSNNGLDPLAKASLETRRDQAKLTPGRFGSVPTRSPNIVVNGVEGWVLEGADPQTTFFEFGTFHAGVTAFVTFQYPTSHKAGPEWVASVLRSIEWS